VEYLAAVAAFAAYAAFAGVAAAPPPPLAYTSFEDACTLTVLRHGSRVGAQSGGDRQGVWPAISFTFPYHRTFPYIHVLD